MRKGDRNRILMLLENAPFPRDRRVRREAVSLCQAGFAVTVVCPRIPGQEWMETYQGVYLLRFPALPEMNSVFGYLFEYGYSFLILFCYALYVFFWQGFDALHIHQPPDTSWLIAGLFKVLGKPYIMDHHDLAPELYDAHFGGQGKKSIRNVLLWLEKRALRLADRIIATNESYRLIDIQRADVHPQKVVVVRNGPDLSHALAAPVLDSGRQSDQVVLGYMGIMGAQDGVDYLLQAVKVLVDDLNEKAIHCVMIGGGDALDGLLRLSRELKIESYMEFTGWIEDISEVENRLRCVDIGISPEPLNPYNTHSTFLKVMDYMTLGIPIVSFDLVESRYSAGEAALYAEPNDVHDFARKIQLLIHNKNLRFQLGEAGRGRIINDLAWEHQAGNLIDMYCNLLNFQG